ncbi:MAG: PAS domain S-box protein [Candidatus Kapaibacterium sp.]
MNQSTIVLIDDEHLVTEDLKILLTTMGYSVPATAATLEDALPLTTSHRPDIIVMDMGLLERAANTDTARNILNTLSIPVVFIADQVDRARLKRAGITRSHGYILKPFDEQEIRMTIDLALAHSTTNTELLESREWLATTLQSIGDAVIATDKQGRVKFMNPVAEQLTGWTQAEATGIPLPDVFTIINQTSRKAVPNPVELVLRDGNIVGLANHTILIAKGGKEYNIDDSAAPIHAPYKELSGVVLTFRDITEKYRIEAAIEASERRFRAMIEHNQDMIRLVDATGKLLYISPSAERITGYTVDEFDGHMMLEITHPDDLSDVLKIIDVLFSRPGVSLHVQYRIRHKAGHWLWMEGTVTNLLHDPAVGAIVSNIRDITPRKLAEEKLRESHALLTSITEGTDDIIFVKDMEGRYMFVNSPITLINGYRPDEMIGKTDHELFPPEPAQKAREIDLEILTTATGQMVENTVRINGTDYTFMTSKNPLYDAHGTLMGVVGVSRDITELKASQAAILQREELYRALIEDSFEGVALTSKEGKVTYTSPANARILGYTPEERANKGFSDLMHPDDVPLATSYFQQMVSGNLQHSHFEIRVQHKDGSWRCVEINSQNMLDNPNIRAIVSNFRDVTDRKNSLEELQNNKENLREIVEAITVPMIITSTEEKKILYGNQLVADMLGLELDDLLTRTPIDFYVHPEDRESAIEELTQNGFVKSREVLFSRTNSEQFWGLLTARKITYAGRNAVVTTIYDITDLKNAEYSLQKNYTLLKTITEGIHESIFAKDTAGNYTFINSTAAESIHKTPEEVIGKDDTALFSPDHAAWLRELDRKIMATGKSETFEGFMTEGVPHYFSDSRYPMHDERTGSIIGVVGISRDITEQKKAEEKLHLYERALLSAAEGIIVTDAEQEDNPIVFVNEGFSEITGYNTKDVIGKNCRFLQGEATDRQAINKIRQCMHEKQYFEGEILNYKKDGTPFWNYLRIAPVPNIHGKITHFIGFQNDITERKNAEKKILESEEKYRSVVENAPDIIMTIDRNNNLTFINHTVPGYTKEQVIGQNAFSFVLPEYVELLKKVFSDVYTLKTTQSFEAAAPGLSGKPAWYLSHASPIFSGNDVVGITLTTRDITDRRQAEEELRQSEKNLHEIVEGITVPMVITSIQTGKVLYGNQLVADLMGVPMDMVLQQEAIDFYSNPDDRTAFVAMLKAQGFVQNHTLKMRRLTGDEIWVLITARIVTFNGEQALAVTLYDISEEKRAEEALLASKTRLRGVIESAMDAIISVDAAFNIVLFNKAAEIMFGCTTDEVLGSSIDRFIPQRFRSSHAYSITKFGHEGITNRAMGHLGLLTGLRYNGQEFPIEASISQIDTPTGKLYTVILRDVTERRQTEQQLREQAAILDLVPDAIIMRDLEHTIISWSKGAENMYGWTAEETIGKSAPELLGISDDPQFLEAKKILHTTGEWSGELRHCTKNGSIILVHSRLKLLFTADGRPNAVLVTNTDITEKKTLEKQLFRAQRLESIGTLASGIAHDLNNILTPVVLGMELIKLKLTDENARKRVDTVISTVKRGSGLIGQVLSFARGSQDNREPINIKYIIDEVAKIARETFPREIEVVLNLPSEDLIVDGNATQIHQIMMNLCINARDAMNEKGGILSIEAGYIVANESLISRYVDAKPGTYVHIVVRDTGTGIPHELQDKIFEPFYTTKEVGKGTGIGLTTVFTIVRNHGGFLGLYSEMGVGTAFSIYLPAELPKSSEQAEASDTAQYSLSGATILLVDDEDLIRNIADDILQAYSYKVFTAKNGAEAVQIYTLNKDQIAVVITDVMMPVMGGIELMGILRGLNPEIRIIAASGVIDGDTTKNLKAAGAQVILLKPFTVDKLLAAIQEVLE